MEWLWLVLIVAAFLVSMYNDHVAAPRRRRRLAAVNRVPVEDSRPAPTPAPAPQPRPVAPVPEQPAIPAALPFDRWWPVAVGKTVHVMLVGETASGKSTTATALLSERAITDRIVIVDPHAKPGDWAGLPAIGHGRDYPAIEQALIDMEREMTDRYELLAQGKPIGEPLTIFIDEYPTIAANCKLAAPAFKALAREARKVSMRLVVLTQDANVKTLGVEGEGLVRENFSRILLGSFAVKEFADLAGQAYPAVFDFRGKTYRVNTTPIPMYKDAKVSLARLWGDLPIEPATGADPWDDGVFAGEPEPVIPVVQSLPIEPVLPHQDAEKSVLQTSPNETKKWPANVPTDDLSVLIRAGLDAGLSRSKIIDLIHIPGGRSAQFQRIKRATGEALDAMAA